MFVVRHADGPLAGHDVSLVSPRTPERLFYAPAPTPAANVVGGYFMCGFDRSPPAPGDWPGMVCYELDRDASALAPHDKYDGMEEGTAVYRQLP